MNSRGSSSRNSRGSSSRNSRGSSSRNSRGSSSRNSRGSSSRNSSSSSRNSSDGGGRLRQKDHVDVVVDPLQQQLTFEVDDGAFFGGAEGAHEGLDCCLF